MASLPSYEAVVGSPVGGLRILASERGAIQRIQFLGGAGSSFELLSEPCPRCEPAVAELSEYFAGRRRTFSVTIDADGTEFQRRVWRELRRIPYGATASYLQVATWLGRPGAARAVGAASGRNPVPIIVPCHRVIGSDGGLTGFAGGLTSKATLLELEAEVVQPRFDFG